MSQKIDLNSRKYYYFVFIIIIIYAWINRFVQDDAFISFRYAQNFVQGNGLVYNSGEKVEGYTNFLWTLIFSGVLKTGFDPIITIQLVSILIFCGTIIFTLRLASSLEPNLSNTQKVLLLIILGSNFSFSSYATGGLETQLQAFCTIGSLTILFKLIEQKGIPVLNLILLGIFLSLGVLNRLDSGLVIAISLSALLILKYLREKSIVSSLVSALIPTALVLLTIGFWFSWKMDYYGEFLPNTFYAKAGGGKGTLHTILRGAYFLALYSTVYIIPLLIFLFIQFRIGQKKSSIHKNFSFLFNAKWVIVLLVISLYVLYILKVGGDFMEFRFLIQLIPLISILTVVGISQILNHSVLVKSTILLVILGLVHNVILDKIWDEYGGVESIAVLQGHIDHPAENWKGIGITLKKHLENEDVKLGISPAGAIAYYSELYCLDLLGLNDQYIARNGVHYKNIPGHNKIAPLSYVKQKEINLVIGHPHMVKNSDIEQEVLNMGSEAPNHFLPKVNFDEIDKPIKVLQIPIDEDYTLLAWYLRDHFKIEQLIQNKVWRQTTVE